MTYMSGVADQLRDAHSLPELLGAACDAFEVVLTLVRRHDRPEDGWFVPMVMAAAWAGDGRDHLLFAPSLPAQRSGEAFGLGDDACAPDGQAAARWLAGLCETLNNELNSAAASAGLIGDRNACMGAASCARQICALMGGAWP